MPPVHATTNPAAFTRTASSRKLLIACALAFGLPAYASSTPILGSANTFAVVGGATVTNTGASTIVGDIGVAPGTAATGVGSAAVTGAIHSADSAATQAHADAATALAYLSGLAMTRDLTGLDLGGMTLTPGVYLLSSSAQLTGALILDAENMANALFVFQIGSTLTTAVASSVSVINGSVDTGVFFDVGTSAVLGANSLFAGNIVAADSITLATAASLQCGRALAVGGAVTLDTNVVSNDCGAGDFGSMGFAGVALAAAQDVPEPAPWLLMPLGLVALGYGRKRRLPAAA